MKKAAKVIDDMLEDNDPWNNRIDVSLVRLPLSDYTETGNKDERKGEPREPSLFDQMNSYLERKFLRNSIYFGRDKEET